MDNTTKPKHQDLHANDDDEETQRMVWQGKTKETHWKYHQNKEDKFGLIETKAIHTDYIVCVRHREKERKKKESVLCDAQKWQ